MGKGKAGKGEECVLSRMEEISLGYDQRDGGSELAAAAETVEAAMFFFIATEMARW